MSWWQWMLAAVGAVPALVSVSMLLVRDPKPKPRHRLAKPVRQVSADRNEHEAWRRAA